MPAHTRVSEVALYTHMYPLFPIGLKSLPLPKVAASRDGQSRDDVKLCWEARGPARATVSPVQR